MKFTKYRALSALVAFLLVALPATSRADATADCKAASKDAKRDVDALFDGKQALLERASKHTPDPRRYLVAGQPVDLSALTAQLRDARTRLLAKIAEHGDRCDATRGASAHDIERLSGSNALAGALPADFVRIEPQLITLDQPQLSRGDPGRVKKRSSGINGRRTSSEIAGDKDVQDRAQSAEPHSEFASPVLGWMAPATPQAVAPNGHRIRPPLESDISGGHHAAPAATSMEASDADQIDAALKRLVPGNVAFNSPDKMRLGKVQTMQVRLSTKLAPEALKASLTEDGKRESAALKVAPRMAATLSGGNAFEISPPGPQTQWVSREEATEWSWEVTPKTEGSQTIVLRLDAIFTVDGKDGPRNVTTLKHKIDVDVGWPATAGEWLAFLKKQIEDAKWLWATVLVPFGLAVLRFRRPKETPPVPPDTTEKNPVKSRASN